MSNECIAPTGRIVKDYLDEFHITQKELCARIGMSEKHISNVLNGNSRLTEEFALKLEKIFPKVPASYWLNYESKYREQLSRQEEKMKMGNWDLDAISKQFYFKEVFKGLNLTLMEQAVEMLKLLKISDFSNFDASYETYAINFMEDGGKREAIAVWLNLCESEIEIQNDDLSVMEYDEKKFKQALKEFKVLSNNDRTEQSIASCRELCNKLGVYLVRHEPIKNSKIRGALTTYNGKPTIYLSGRFQTHDHIWFAFMHEVGHLLLHYNKKDIFVSFEDDIGEVDNREDSANEFARDFFISPGGYRQFVLENKFTAESIRAFASEQNTLPKMVVGRLQHDKKIGFNQFNQLH